MEISVNPIPDVALLLPHGNHMVLLDRVVTCEKGRCVACAMIAPNNPFSDNQGNVPSYLGIEYLVQAVAALVGFARFERGLDPLVGLVLGTRRSRFIRASFPLGSELTIDVQQVLLEEPLGVFDGEITIGGELIVQGQVKAIQPRDDKELNELLGSLE